MIGREYAEQILTAQRAGYDQRQWQIRKGEILKSGVPVYWSSLCRYLNQQVEDFNSTQNVTKEWGLDFFGCDTYLTITKKSSPVFILKAAIIPGERVRVTTQIFGPGFSSEPAERYCVFDVSKRDCETIELDGRGFYQFGEGLFSEAAKRFLTGLSLQP